jgi:enoyl-CoA hydratase
LVRPGARITTEAGALRITLDRPGHLNALTADMADRVADEVERAAVAEDVRVIVLAGTGPAFSAGADLSGEDAHENFDVTSLDRANRIIRAITGSPKPVVAAVNGVAAGVGCSAALACDLVVAAESASFLLAFSRIGLMPDGGATATVAASVGRARAMRMALLAEPMAAREAFDAGLVSHLAADGDFAEAVEAVVGRLTAGPPLAYAATKAVNRATLHGLEDALERRRRGQTVLLRTTTPPRACGRSPRSARSSAGVTRQRRRGRGAGRRTPTTARRPPRPVGRNSSAGRTAWT